MKKFIRTALSSAILCSLIACSNSETNSENTSMLREQHPTKAVMKKDSKDDKDKLPIVKVAALEEYQPYIFLNNNQFVGLEADILHKIGENKGFQVEFVLSTLENAYSELGKKRVDIVAMGAAQDEVNGSVAVPSESYMHSGDCLAQMTNMLSPDWKNARIGIINGENMNGELSQHLKIEESQFMLHANHSVALNALAQGKTNVLFGDCVALRFHANNGELKDKAFNITEYTNLDLPESATNMVFIISKDEPKLVQTINEGLAELKQSGELDKILQKWATYPK
ncbi:substrate-binding periplasmic protein [Wielerella bovis]|uniref:substrate-binding periplasmic protein n=1 Tax=Wielerella bovis TaxID=2917790 RepID=UPI00201880E4|nr:transporter substrate-binding domain-containing protein [Wielerella bovis]MCG7657076.1 transporter substrate-binding domain-containing protein [Wielerella bovis]MCG7659299.1 transporter substrate-binding domain-containing protein [Wielerella bovis]